MSGVGNRPEHESSGVLERWAAQIGRAVIFDFNGTLSNDEPILLRLFGEMFEEHLGWHLSVDDYFNRLAGRSDREIVELVVNEEGGGDATLVELLLRERRDRYCQLVGARSPIETETVELLSLLREAGVPLAIVTGAQRIDVDFVLSKRGLQGAFSVIVTEEDVKEGKPHPEGFLRAAALLGVDPGDVLVFEDSLFGLRAARAAGMASVGLVGTKSRHELEGEADLVVDSLGPGLLDALLAR